MTDHSLKFAPAFGRIFLLLAGCFSLVACDKIKEVADEVKSKVDNTLEERLEEDPVEEPEANPLMALVDHTEEGYVFRKDLDFPNELKVETSFKQKISGRLIRQSQAGRSVEAVKGKESITAEFERKGSAVVFSITDSSFELPPVPSKGEDGSEAAPTKAQNPFHQAPPPAKPMTFVRQDKGWKGKAGGDFKLMAMSQQLSPVFGEMLVENGVLPRPLWFSPSRVKIGDEIELSGGALAMVVSGKAKGRLKLKLEEIDEVNGHPCGLFSVSGEFSRNNFPNLAGLLLDQEVTVESGELWLSLIYPVILKEKLVTIQTFKPSEGGGSLGKGQGSIDTLVVRDWQADIPISEPEVEEAPAVEVQQDAEG